MTAARRVLRHAAGFGIVVGAVALYMLLSLLPMLLGASAVQGALVGGIAITALLAVPCARGTFGIRRPVPARAASGRDYAMWAAIFLLAAFFFEVLFAFVDGHVADPGMADRETAVAEADLFSTVLLSLVVAPVAEEAMMRLFCYNVVKARSGRWAAMLCSAIVFAWMHGTIAHMLVATLLGCLLVFSYEATGKWFVPIMGHLIYNNFIVFAFSDGAFALSRYAWFMGIDAAAVAGLLVLGWTLGFHRKEAP